MKKFVPTVACVSALLLSSAVLAQGTQVIWKLVDKRGRVTYADQPPKEFDGTVTRLEVPIDSPALQPSPTGRTAQGGATAPAAAPGGRPSAELAADLTKARARLEEARKALDAGKEPGPDDVVWVGRKGGGARPEISDAYAARVKKLEDAVRVAEEEVDRLERGTR